MKRIHGNYAMAKQILLQQYIINNPGVDCNLTVPVDDGLDLTSFNEVEEEGRHLIPEICSRRQFVACDECGLAFQTNYNLKRHKRSFHASKETPCPHPFCQMSFSDKFMMIRHKLSCFLHCQWPDCDMKFTRPKLFQQHLNGHESRKARLL